MTWVTPPSARAGIASRSRGAPARLDVLTDADGAPRLRAGQRVVLNLFDDASFAATIDAVDAGPDGYTWSATLDGIDQGHAVVALSGGALAGTVIMPGAVYRIGYQPDGSPVIEQIDTSLLPTEADPLVPPLTAPDPDRAPAAAADSGNQIDVMILYTPPARFSAGGSAAIQAEASAAVATANQAYANTGIVQRLRLVFVGEVAIGQTSDFVADLNALRNNGTIGVLRNTYGADLVSLFTDRGPSAQFCGIAYAMTVNASVFAPWAYSMVERACAVGNLTFAHELGHNMGSDHDLYVAVPNGGLAPYSHGYVDLVGRFRTIMAYNNQCAASGFSCPRIPYFETPNRTFNGRVVGNASSADNARTFSETANTIANFRQAVVGGGSTFGDVPSTSPYWSWIEALVATGITSGCSADPPLYCPTTAVTRGQMAAFLLKGMAYPGTPSLPPATGLVFADVPASLGLAASIEAFYAAGITTGCGINPLRYCPNQTVNRDQMAVFLLRARHGASYVPPLPSQQLFADVPLDHPFARWIYQIAAEGVITACSTASALYCPGSPVTREEMAVFLVRAFNLPH
jgi:hypothetical protein